MKQTTFETPEVSSDSDEDDFTVTRVAPAADQFGPHGTRQASVRWFKETQLPSVMTPEGNGFVEWFHGIISRRESERLLESRPIGCFLVRVSESRFGYTLSFRCASASHASATRSRSGACQ